MASKIYNREDQPLLVASGKLWSRKGAAVSLWQQPMKTVAYLSAPSKQKRSLWCAQAASRKTSLEPERMTLNVYKKQDLMLTTASGQLWRENRAIISLWQRPVKTVAAYTAAQLDEGKTLWCKETALRSTNQEPAKIFSTAHKRQDPPHELASRKLWDGRAAAASLWQQPAKANTSNPIKKAQPLLWAQEHSLKMANEATDLWRSTRNYPSTGLWSPASKPTPHFREATKVSVWPSQAGITTSHPPRSPPSPAFSSSGSECSEASTISGNSEEAIGRFPLVRSDSGSSENLSASPQGLWRKEEVFSPNKSNSLNVKHSELWNDKIVEEGLESAAAALRLSKLLQFQRQHHVASYSVEHRSLWQANAARSEFGISEGCDRRPLAATEGMEEFDCQFCLCGEDLEVEEYMYSFEGEEAEVQHNENEHTNTISSNPFAASLPIPSLRSKLKHVRTLPIDSGSVVAVRRHNSGGKKRSVETAVPEPVELGKQWLRRKGIV